MPAANGLARQPPLAQVMASASQQGPRPGIQGTVNQQHLSAGAKRPLEGPPGGQPPPKRAATPPVGAAAREGRQDLDDDLDLFKVCLLACACVQGGHSQPPASTEKDASSKTRKNYLCTAHLLSCLAPLHSVVGWHSALPCPRLASRGLSIHMLLTTKWSEGLSANVHFCSKPALIWRQKMKLRRIVGLLPVVLLRMPHRSIYALTRTCSSIWCAADTSLVHARRHLA